MRNLIRLAVFLAFIAGNAASGQRPNIVLILSDDQGWDDVGSIGGEFYETARLDRLARAGMVCSNAYSGGPKCAPTRASPISGMYVPCHRIYTPGGQSKCDPRRMRLWVPVQDRYLERDGVTDPLADPFEVRQALELGVERIAEVLKRGG